LNLCSVSDLWQPLHFVIQFFGEDDFTRSVSSAGGCRAVSPAQRAQDALAPAGKMLPLPKIQSSVWLSRVALRFVVGIGFVDGKAGEIVGHF
jgi:hypothetical protein